jgi:hypothetical protein
MEENVAANRECIKISKRGMEAGKQRRWEDTAQKTMINPETMLTIWLILLPTGIHNPGNLIAYTPSITIATQDAFFVKEGV